VSASLSRQDRAGAVCRGNVCDDNLKARFGAPPLASGAWHLVPVCLEEKRQIAWGFLAAP